MGDRLRDLIANREEIDQFLEKTLEFNERFFDPQSWQAKLRKKQRVEQRHLAEMRDMRRIKLLEIEIENEAKMEAARSPDSGKHRPAEFDQNIRKVEQIFKDLDPYREHLLKKRSTMLL